jgi:hypothetical protein
MPLPTYVPGQVLNADDVSLWLLHRFAYKTSDTTRTSTTTLTNDPHLVVPVDASAVYQFNCLLDYTSGATEDINVTFTAPSGATLDWNGAGYTGTDVQMWNGGNAAAVAVVFGGGNAARRFIDIKGMIQTSVTSGNLTLQWAQAVSGASSAVLRTYSYLKVLRVG